MKNFRSIFAFAIACTCTCLLPAKNIELLFPESPVGKIMLVNPDDPTDYFAQPASGTVSLSFANELTLLSLSKAGAKDLSFLRDLPPDSIDTLRLTGCQLSSQHLEAIATLSGISSIEFSGCDFEPGAFAGIPALPKLKRLQVSTSGRTDLANWIKQHQHLEQIFAQPSLQLSDIKTLGQFPSLRKTTIRLQSGTDSKELLESAVSNFPNLNYLVVICDQSFATDESLSCLANLKELEELRWFFGSADQNLFVPLTSLKQLKRLHLAQVDPSQDFFALLRKLRSLEELRCSNMDIEGDLIGAIKDLPNLKVWPKVQSVNSADLKRIARCKEITSLTIQGLTPQTNENELWQTLSNLPNLQELDLQNMPFSDQGLESLRGARELKSVKLFATAVSGFGFAQLRHLPKLERIHWYGGHADDEPVPLDLTEITALKHLKFLEIGGPAFVPENLLCLSDCKQLQYIRLWGGGFADDSVAATIAQLPNLRKVTFSDNCVVTDEGMKSFAGNSSLQELFVGGFFNSDSVEELAELPQLNRLIVRSHNMADSDIEQLRLHHPGIPQISGGVPRTSVVIGDDGILRKKLPGEDLVEKSEDGFLRRKGRSDPSLRERMNALEGKAVSTIARDNEEFSLKLDELHGKVILLDFWGTWCGPCRAQVKNLKRLKETHPETDFQILGVHTSNWADKLDAFVSEKEINWPNIVDQSGEIAETFQVPHYPSYFLFDRDGVLRVALVHKLGLDDAVSKLVEESN